MRGLVFVSLIVLAFFHMPATAGESVFVLADEMGARDVKAVLAPGVALFWGDQAPPDGLAERSRPDLFSGVSVNVIPFAGGAGNCREALMKSLRNMIGDANNMGYDVIYGIRNVVNGVPAGDMQRLTCQHMVHVSSVKFQAVFARTPAAAARVAEANALALKLAGESARKPVKNGSYLPLKPILSSPEAQALLGKDMTWFAGSASTAAYPLQLGPFEYEGEGKVTKSGEAGACKGAVLEALASMVDDAKDKGYSALTRIHSYFNETRTPTETDVECEINGSKARVVLRSALASMN